MFQEYASTMIPWSRQYKSLLPSHFFWSLCPLPVYHRINFTRFSEARRNLNRHPYSANSLFSSAKSRDHQTINLLFSFPWCSYFSLSLSSPFKLSWTSHGILSVLNLFSTSWHRKSVKRAISAIKKYKKATYAYANTMVSQPMLQRRLVRNVVVKTSPRLRRLSQIFVHTPELLQSLECRTWWRLVIMATQAARRNLLWIMGISLQLRLAWRPWSSVLFRRRFLVDG